MLAYSCRGTTIGGRFWLRVCVAKTKEEDVDALLDVLRLAGPRC
jgi:hypothetical protein